MKDITIAAVSLISRPAEPEINFERHLPWITITYVIFTKSMKRNLPPGRRGAVSCSLQWPIMKARH